MIDYYLQRATEDGISGDDVNRRHREDRYGFKAPSNDWVDCKAVIKCLWPNQYSTTYDSSIKVYYHN